MTDRPVWLLDEATIDSLVEDDEVPARFGPLATFAAAVHAVGDRPAPTPSPELAALLGGAVPLTAPVRRSWRPGLVAKVALGGVVAAAALGGAAAAQVLPEPVNDAVREVIEVVTPIEFGDSAESPEPTATTTTDPDRTTTSTEATTTTDPDPTTTSTEATTTTTVAPATLPAETTSLPSGPASTGLESSEASDDGRPQDESTQAGDGHEGTPPEAEVPDSPVILPPTPAPTDPPPTIGGDGPRPTHPPHPTHPSLPPHPRDLDPPDLPDLPDLPDAPDLPDIPDAPDL